MPDTVDTALRAAAEAAAHAAQEVLDAYHIKMGGVLVVAELPSRETANAEKIVETASWLYVSNESSLPVVADTLRGVVERLHQQQRPVPPTNTTSN